MRHFRFYCLFVAALAAGCGTFGGTRAFTLRDGIPLATDVRATFGGLAKEQDASKAVAVFVFGFSGFDEDDENNLASSLESTLASMNRAGTGPERHVIVHVMVRRYMVVASNNAVGVLACVSWALVEQRRAVFSEQFYAAHSGFLVATVGGTKNDVNEAIVRRVALRALWASRPSPSRGEAPITQKTFDDIDSAAREVPSQFVTIHSLTRYFLVASQAPQWGWAEVSEPLDWNKVLAERGLVDPQ